MSAKFGVVVAGGTVGVVVGVVVLDDGILGTDEVVLISGADDITGRTELVCKSCILEDKTGVDDINISVSDMFKLLVFSRIAEVVTDDCIIVILSDIGRLVSDGNIEEKAGNCDVCWLTGADIFDDIINCDEIFTESEINKDEVGIIEVLRKTDSVEFSTTTDDVIVCNINSDDVIETTAADDEKSLVLGVGIISDDISTETEDNMEDGCIFWLKAVELPVAEIDDIIGRYSDEISDVTYEDGIVTIVTDIKLVIMSAETVCVKLS